MGLTNKLMVGPTPQKTSQLRFSFYTFKGI